MLSVAQVKARITTSVDDDDLGDILDEAYADIEAADGPTGELTEYRRAGEGPLLVLGHDAASITSVTEDANSAAPISLDAGDYRLRPSGGLLERLSTGPHPRRHWIRMVKVVYVRRDVDATHDRVALELVRLDLTSHPGVIAESTSEWSKSYDAGSSYEDLRKGVLATLQQQPEVVIF